MPRPPTDWITLADAAALLAGANVHFRPSTIGSWARRGDLQSIKIGGRRYVRKAEVRRLVAPRRAVSAADLQGSLFDDAAG